MRWMVAVGCLVGCLLGLAEAVNSHGAVFAQQPAVLPEGGGASLRVSPQEGGFLARAKRHVAVSNASQKFMPCGVFEVVTSSSDMDVSCPAQCPFFATKTGDGVKCNFGCVPASSCSYYNPEQPVPDNELGICRSCWVPGCATCQRDGTDRCAACAEGFVLKDGRCLSNYRYVWDALFLIAGLLGLAVVAWFVSLATAPVVNQTVLERAFALRSRAKLHMPLNPWVLGSNSAAAAQQDDPGRDSVRRIWPLCLDLSQFNVAGPGITLFFNFSKAIIFWALAIVLGWALLAWIVDDNLFTLGTLASDGTPRKRCFIVAWGFETQHRLMWAKIGFLFCVYVFSFIGAMAFSIRQLRLFQSLKGSSHMCYAARLSGLPEMTGAEEAEIELKKTIERQTNQTVIGVSICWDFERKADLLMHVLEDDMLEAEEEQFDAVDPRRDPDGGDDENSPVSPIRRLFDPIEHFFVAPSTQRILRKCHGSKHMDTHRHKKVNKKGRPTLRRSGAFAAHRTGTRSSDIGGDAKDMSAAEGSEAPTDQLVVCVEDELSALKSTDSAFVIFESELARNAAVERAGELEAAGGSLKFKGATLTLTEATCEPDTIIWTNCQPVSVMERCWRIVMGVLKILAALLIWMACFYAPYAYFIMSFNYAFGFHPDIFVEVTFTLLVCGGNVTMYCVCSFVADSMRFMYVDSREVCYMLLYCFACCFNVVLDLVVSYHIAYKMLVSVDYTTYDGTPLAHVETFTERFESYAMQRELGQSLYDYCFPATFLVPFLIEPIATIYLPYKIMSYIVRSHRAIKTHTAEAYLASTPMDLSRYADLLLNVFLAVGIFYFPGGFTIPVFAGLALSHIYVYGFDHYRVLRCIPFCDFSGMDVDWWAQWMLCLPCGLMLSQLVFKSNCEDDFIYPHCASGPELVFKCAAPCLLHILVHTLVLVYVIPFFGLHDKKPPSKLPYKDCAEAIPCSFFNANPINALRSKYFYKDVPHCQFCIYGKEHFICKNEEIGCYYSGVPAEVEDFQKHTADEIKKTLEDSKKAADDAFRSMKSKASAALTPIAERAKRTFRRGAQDPNAAAEQGNEDTSPTSGPSTARPENDRMDTIPSVKTDAEEEEPKGPTQ
eukprot:TRINITY_DN20479_c0_g2_i1.p1 TRINITY_DN20479_c0_g2~~TRINITY_DN20479_c0_g2_i1.p1  ORF type:complete len:1113 (+),score=232.11 TRINITY_DN20479_c0_g2_i1:129-3467(+)